MSLVCYTRTGIPFTIRPAETGDQPAILANIDAVCAEEIYLSTDTYVPTSDWRHVFEDPSNNGDSHLLIVAQTGGVIIGHLRVFPALPGSKCRHVGDIGIVLITAWRDQGIGTAMLEYSIAWAGQSGYEKLIASTMATNQRAMKIFSKLGFIQEGIRKAQFLVQGNYIDEVLLGLLLEPLN